MFAYLIARSVDLTHYRMAASKPTFHLILVEQGAV
jgi:hypothetical protein